MEGIGPNSCTKQQVLEKKARPQEQLNCPRCNSTNTKFCYYNNYSLTQPRYFCKTCRRYWTEGGSLRNVPVGGGSRKNKKITTSTSTSSSAAVAAATASSLSKAIPDLNPPTNTTLQVSSSAVNSSSQQNPKMHGGQDLNLAFPAMDHHNYHHHHGMTPYVEMHHNSHEHQSSSSHHAPNSLSALELLRSSMASRGLNNPYAPPNNNSSSLMQNSSNAAALYPSGFPTMQEVKPSLGFSMVDHNHHHHGINGNRTSYDHHHHHHQVQDQSGGSNSGRLLFPFGDHVKQLSAGAAEVAVEQHNKEQGNSTGYWTGMIGEGSW